MALLKKRVVKHIGLKDLIYRVILSVILAIKELLA
jgi:hypothetical protein